jgi:hypothetical protein
VLSLCLGRQTEQQKEEEKRGSDDALALGGRCFTIKTNNQPIFMENGRWNARGCMGGAGRVGGVLYHCFGANTPSNKKHQKHNRLWPYMAARDYILDTTTNQQHSAWQRRKRI